MFFNIFLWVIIGIFAGLLVYLIFPRQRKYLLGTLTAGIVGAFVGGIIYSAFSIGSVAMFIDPWASLMAVLGSGVLIYLVYLLVKSENNPIANDKNDRLP